MAGLPLEDRDDWAYTLPYRSRTQLWNTVVRGDPRPLCHKGCGNMSGDGRMRDANAQTRPPYGREQMICKREELHKEAEALISEISASMRTRNY